MFNSIRDAMSGLDFQTVQNTILQRQSIGQLVEPAPDAHQLDLAFTAALTAPDHHRLKPTRFIVVSNQQRQAFGGLLSEAIADLGESDPVQVERVKQHPMRAPLLVLALTKVQNHPKVPEFEQLLSTGAAIENFILSLHAQGFACMWRSGAVVESRLLKQALGFEAQDYISGILYIGTAAKAIAPREPIQLSDYVSIWQPQAEL